MAAKQTLLKLPLAVTGLDLMPKVVELNIFFLSLLKKLIKELHSGLLPTYVRRTEAV